MHQQKGTVLTTCRLLLSPLIRTFREINDYGHNEDFKKNRGVYCPLAEPVAYNRSAPGTVIKAVASQNAVFFPDIAIL
jgi:hypothetical protein